MTNGEQNTMEMLTVKEVAARLHLCTKTVIKIIRGKDLPAIIMGNGYRISPVDLEAYIKGRSGEVVVADKPQTEADQVANRVEAEARKAEVEARKAEAEARKSKAQLEISRANKDIEIINGERLASDKVKALAEELSELQLKLDKDRVAMDDKGKALDEAYAMKVYQVDAAVEGRIAKGIVEGTKEAAAEFVRKLKEALGMYRQGKYWAELYIEIVRLQGGHTDLGGRMRVDMEKRAEALGLIDHTFDIVKTEPKMIEERAMDKRNRQ